MRGIMVDNFAGAGGASTGIELATGRSVDIAINHDIQAIRMHEANHPDTKHYCESVWDVDPVEACAGRPVALAWFSPDCKHFSKAKGGTPVDKNIRGLAWVAVRWAKKVRPRVIMLENVEEFKTWGPLMNSSKGWVPDPKKKGQTFELFKKSLENLGYQVQFRELRACDYGAPTIRKRLFMVARCDGKPIVWPEPTHGNPHSLEVVSGLLKPWRTASEIIDWSIPCPSIFDTAEEIKEKYGLRAKRPLADNTLKRIAAGIQKFVIDNPKPFIMQIGQQGFCGDKRSYPLSQPLTTVVTKQEHCLITPYMTQVNHSKAKHHYCKGTDQPLGTLTSKHGYGVVMPYLISYHTETADKEVRGIHLNDPLHTIDTSNRFGLVSAFVSKYFTGVDGSKMDKPLPTVTSIDHNAIVTSHIIQMNNNMIGTDMKEPLNTIVAGPGHIGEVRAFFTAFFGNDVGQDMNDPLRTTTTKDRFGIVTVHGVDYQIVDICMRMLTPRELASGNGLPETYIIEHDSTGEKITKTEQVKKIGNLVVPHMSEALTRANLPEYCEETYQEFEAERCVV